MKTIVCTMFLFNSCYTTTTQKKSGIFVYRTTYYDSTSGKYESNETKWPEAKVWYDGDYAIDEVKQLIIRQDGNEPEKLSLRKVYHFVNLKRMSSNSYLNFSDTAISFLTTKIGERREGDVRTVLGKSTELRSTEPPRPLKDTSIKGVTYSRQQYIFKWNDTLTEIKTCYFRCDLPDFRFPFYKKASEEKGCPILISESEISNRANDKQRSEIIFVSDHFSEQEKKIFEAWKRNDQQNNK